MLNCSKHVQTGLIQSQRLSLAVWWEKYKIFVMVVAGVCWTFSTDLNIVEVTRVYNNNNNNNTTQSTVSCCYCNNKNYKTTIPNYHVLHSPHSGVYQLSFLISRNYKRSGVGGWPCQIFPFQVRTGNDPFSGLPESENVCMWQEK